MTQTDSMPDNSNTAESGDTGGTCQNWEQSKLDLQKKCANSVLIESAAVGKERNFTFSLFHAFSRDVLLTIYSLPRPAGDSCAVTAGDSCDSCDSDICAAQFENLNVIFCSGSPVLI